MRRRSSFSFETRPTAEKPTNENSPQHILHRFRLLRTRYTPDISVCSPSHTRTAQKGYIIKALNKEEFEGRKKFPFCPYYLFCVNLSLSVFPSLFLSRSLPLPNLLCPYLISSCSLPALALSAAIDQQHAAVGGARSQLGVNQWQGNGAWPRPF